MPPVKTSSAHDGAASAQERESGTAAVCYEQAETFYRDGNLIAAVNELVKTVTVDPDYPHARTRLEHWSEELEDVTLEVVQLRDSISHNSNSPEDHYNLAKKLRLLGDTAGARAEWQKVVELEHDPWSKSARKMLGKYN